MFSRVVSKIREQHGHKYSFRQEIIVCRNDSFLVSMQDEIGQIQLSIDLFTRILIDLRLLVVPILRFSVVQSHTLVLFFVIFKLLICLSTYSSVTGLKFNSVSSVLFSSIFIIINDLCLYLWGPGWLNELGTWIT